jgi:hypothetical protein
VDPASARRPVDRLDIAARQREFSARARGLADARFRASLRRQDCSDERSARRELFWFTVSPIEGAEEGTDRWAAEQGWVSLTPLRLDLTDEALLRAVCASRPLDEAVAAAVSPSKSSEQAAESVREDEAPASIPLNGGASRR